MRSLVVVALLTTCLGSARADATADEARRLFEDGRKEFNLGEFRTAAEKYKQVYRLKPDPSLLYNIAQSYRLAGDLTNALFFYRQYQRNAPDMPGAMRREVDARIKQLDEQIAAGTTQVAPSPKPTTPEPASSANTPSTPPPPTPTEPSPPKPVEPTTAEAPKPAPMPILVEAPPASESAVVVAAKPLPAYKKWWVWTVVGVAVVGIGVGVGVGVALAKPSVPRSELGAFKVFE